MPLKETQESMGWTLGATVQVLANGTRKSRLHTWKELSRGQKKQNPGEHRVMEGLEDDVSTSVINPQEAHGL